MKRRALLGLLGLGSAGGAAFVLSSDRLQLSNNNGNEQATPTSGTEDSFSDWGSELQSELNSEPVYGEVSFATTSETVEIEDDTQISTVSIEPNDSDSDVFQFTATEDETVSEVSDLVSGTVRFSEEVEFTATIDGSSMEFTGGESDIGNFAGAIATHPTDSVVYLVRASSVDVIEDRVSSVDA